MTISCTAPAILSPASRGTANGEAFEAIFNGSTAAGETVCDAPAANMPELSVDIQIDMPVTEDANAEPAAAMISPTTAPPSFIPAAATMLNGISKIAEDMTGNDNEGLPNTQNAAPATAVAQIIAVLTPTISSAAGKTAAFKKDAPSSTEGSPQAISLPRANRSWPFTENTKPAVSDMNALQSASGGVLLKTDNVFAAMTADANLVMTAAPVTHVAPTSMASATPTTDLRQLYLASDGQWIDTLRNEIVSNATRDNQLQFTLKPEHLGRLDIALVCADGQVDIRMDASTPAAANIIASGHTQLVEELRNAGVKVGQFDMTNGQNGARHQQPQQQHTSANEIQPTPNRPADSKEIRGRFA